MHELMQQESYSSLSPTHLLAKVKAQGNEAGTFCIKKEEERMIQWEPQHHILCGIDLELKDNMAQLCNRFVPLKLY